MILGVSAQHNFLLSGSLLSGARERPANLIPQAEFEEVVGAGNICDSVGSALRCAQQVHEELEGVAVGLRS
jgi:hypothetical protein